MTRKVTNMRTPALIIVLALFAAMSDIARCAETQNTEKPASSDAHLKMWRVLSRGAFLERGQITVKNRQITLQRGGLATGIGWKGEVPKGDYEITLEAKKLDGKDFFCGLTFPIQKEFCTLIVGGWGGKVTGLSNVDGEPAVENETVSIRAYEVDRWYKIRLRVTTDRVTAWIDKKPVVNLVTTGRKFSLWLEQEPARPIGISSWQTSATFRNFRVASLNKPPVKKSEPNQE